VETSRDASLKAQATTITFKPTPGAGGSQWDDNGGQSYGQHRRLGEDRRKAFNRKGRQVEAKNAKKIPALLCGLRGGASFAVKSFLLSV
jgi:hypothetical protein